MSDAMPPGPYGSPGAALPAPRTLVLGYAGFWWRVLAFLIDTVVLGIVQGGLARVTGLSMLGVGFREPGPEVISPVDWSSAGRFGYHPHGHLHWHGGWLTLLCVLIAVAYYVLLESSAWQATVGKRACRIRVTDLAGRRIGIGRALGRYLAKFLSWALLGIGFLMVGWTRRKQGLHDMLAGTLVMRVREADPVFAFQAPPR